MEAERLAQFFLLPELLHHLIELTEQLAKFVRASAAARSLSIGFATSRLIITAVNIPNAIPITPTNTASHASFVAGDRGATNSNNSEAIGQMDAETAHTIPRPRSERVKMFGVRSARASRKKKGNVPH